MVEILVVVALVGILSAVLYASFSEARIDARNKAMQSELKEMQLALELYKAQNGVYPDTISVGSPCNGSSFGIDWADSSQCGNLEYIVGLTPDFIAELPSHTTSANSNCNVKYQVRDDGSWYKLTAEHCVGGASSAAEGVQLGDEFARCLSSCPVAVGCNATYAATAPFYESYAVYSAGGECQ